VYKIIFLLMSYFTCCDLYSFGAEHDTTSREKFIYKVGSTRFEILMKFYYIDSIGVKNEHVNTKYSLVEQISKNLSITYDSSKKILIKNLLESPVLKYEKVGPLVGISVQDEKFLSKWVKKGKKKYIHEFYENGVILKNEYFYSKHPGFFDVLVVGYDLGIVVAWVEEKYVILDNLLKASR